MKGGFLLDFQDVLGTYKSKQYGIKALSKYINWFPIKPSIILAGIVADLMGDGHLQDEPNLRLDYTSKSSKELKRFEKEVVSLFGIKGKIRKCTTNKYNTKNLGINNKPLARVLKLIGVPTGAKVLKKFSIPKWILKDKKLFSRFLNRLFSCEGCIDLKNRYIEISMYKSLELIKNNFKFFKDIKFYLEKHFQIKTINPFLGSWISKRKDGKRTRGVRLKIKNQDSLKRFQKFIGFEDRSKKERLSKIID